MSDERQPYAPPESAVQDVVEIRPRPITGVVMGTVVDLGGTIVAAIVFAIIYAIYLRSKGVAQEEIGTILTTMPVGSVYFFIATAAGSLFSMLGGYVCASYSQRNVYRSGMVMATVVSVVGYLIGGPNDSELLEALMIMLTYAAVLSGVWLQRRRVVSGS